MEISLVARVTCTSQIQCNFIQRMLGDDTDRPLFEDDVDPQERDWFNALEDTDTVDSVSIKGDRVLYINWLVTDTDEIRDLFGYLSRAEVEDIYGVIAGDEGWYELWIVEKGKLKEYGQWNGKSVTTLCEKERSLGKLLERIRNENKEKLREQIK